MAQAKTGTVYTLIDPRDGTVCYVGATVTSLKIRLANHLRVPPNMAVAEWISDLATTGSRPVIEAVHEGVSRENLAEAERVEILEHFEQGCPMLNHCHTPADYQAQRRAYIRRGESPAHSTRRMAMDRTRDDGCQEVTLQQMAEAMDRVSERLRGTA